MSFVVLFMLFDVMLYVEMSWRNVNNKIYKKNADISISDRYLGIRDRLHQSLIPFHDVSKKQLRPKNLVAEKVSATG